MQTEDQQHEVPHSPGKGRFLRVGIYLAVMLIVGLLLGKVIPHLAEMTSLSEFGGSQIEVSDGHAELQKLQEIYRNFWTLQQAQVSDAAWADYKIQVQQSMDPEIQSLKGTACSQYPHLQHLLWAGRDYLPLMLETARTTPSEAQVKFIKNLKAADSLINQ